jgi:hypothetical protein
MSGHHQALQSFPIPAIQLQMCLAFMRLRGGRMNMTRVQFPQHSDAIPSWRFYVVTPMVT